MLFLLIPTNKNQKIFSQKLKQQLNPDANHKETEIQI